MELYPNLSVDYLYVDTTFANQDFNVFPQRKESLAAILDAIRQFSSSQRFIITGNLLGIECIWISIANHFKEKVYVCPSLLQLYKSFKDCNEEESTIYPCCICEILSSDENECRFFASYPTNTKNLIEICPTTMFWARENELYKCFTSFDFVKLHISKESIRVLYSMHSSLDELRSFIEWIRPGQIYPCAWPDNTNPSQVAMLFKDLIDVSKIVMIQQIEAEPIKSSIVESEKFRQIIEYLDYNDCLSEKNYTQNRFPSIAADMIDTQITELSQSQNHDDKDSSVLESTPNFLKPSSLHSSLPFKNINVATLGPSFNDKSSFSDMLALANTAIEVRKVDDFCFDEHALNGEVVMVPPQESFADLNHQNSSSSSKYLNINNQRSTMYHDASNYIPDQLKISIPLEKQLNQSIHECTKRDSRGINDEVPESPDKRLMRIEASTMEWYEYNNGVKRDTPFIPNRTNSRYNHG